MVDIERAVELAAELSGLDAEGWRRQILSAWSFPEIILEDEDDPNWLRQHGSDWVIYMSLSKLGETPHPMLATELSRRVETIRSIQNDVDARRFPTVKGLDALWLTLRTVQQLVQAFDPARQRN